MLTSRGIILSCTLATTVCVAYELWPQETQTHNGISNRAICWQNQHKFFDFFGSSLCAAFHWKGVLTNTYTDLGIIRKLKKNARVRETWIHHARQVIHEPVVFPTPALFQPRSRRIVPRNLLKIACWRLLCLHDLCTCLWPLNVSLILMWVSDPYMSLWPLHFSLVRV